MYATSNTPQGDNDGIHQPRRLQHLRTTGARLPKGAVVVTRASRWGNPFRTEEYGRNDAIERYRQWITTGTDRFPAGKNGRSLDPIRCRAELHTLRGRDLACSCPLGVRCHADVLLELANRRPGIGLVVGRTFEDAGHLVSGTCQVGQLLASFEQLVAAFGPPHRREGLDRATAQWCIRTRAGILTIYDRSAWPDGGGVCAQGAVWWDLGGHANEHTDCPLHPVATLAHELTGLPVRDARPWQCRPDGLRPPEAA